MKYRKTFNRITLIAWITIAVVFIMWSIALHPIEANTLFKPAVNYSAGDQPCSVATGDFNGDANPDLAVAIVWTQNGGGPPVAWTQNFGGPSYEEARSVIETADGSLIVAGWSNTEHNKEDVYVVKTDSNGSLIWENTYGTEIHERAYAIRETADGFVIAGRASSLETPPKEHALLLKIGKNGELIWKKLFGKDQASGARDVQVTSDGGYVIAGWTSTKRHTDATDIYVVKTNQDGDVEWEQRYQRVLWQGAHTILQDSNNGYVISGIERPSAGARLNGYTMGIDSFGAFVWDRTDGDNGWDEWHGIAHAVDSGFVLSGGTKLSGNKRSAWIMKIDPMGHMTWKNELMGTYAYSWTIIQGHDGGYVFTGETADICDGYVVKVDESGEYIWGVTLGSYHEYCDCLRSLVATSDGGYVAVGFVGKEQGKRPTSNYQPDWDRDLWLVKIQSGGYPIAEIIGTWSSGIWYWDVATSSWTQMYSGLPSAAIAAGDFTGGGKADVASIWSSGLWYQDGDSLGWTQVYHTAPDRIAAGDITGDGVHEIIGCGGAWGSGVWYRDVANGTWHHPWSGVPDGPIAAGDVTGDGKVDMISCWDSGLWFQDGATLSWTKVWKTAPYKVTCGDVTGDKQAEIISTWSSGIWYWDVAASKWTKMYRYPPTGDTPSGDIAAGDFTRDGKADVASCWDSGLWFQDGATLGWKKVCKTAPYTVTAGNVTGK